MEEVKKVRESLLARVKKMDNPREILRDRQLRELYKVIPSLPIEQRPEFGQQINELKNELEKVIEAREVESSDEAVVAIDVTAPMAINAPLPQLMTADRGSRHPLMSEIENIVRIYNLMGFDAIESRQLDSEYNMFTSLNFPPGHPARDMYDAFWTEEGFVPPGHTSTMQNRILRAGRDKLKALVPWQGRFHPLLA